MDIEKQLSEILMGYLKFVPYDDVNLTSSIMLQLYPALMRINEKYEDDFSSNHGVYVLPLQRCSGYFITRLIFFNYFQFK